MKLLIISNTDHAVEPIHCSHQMQYKAGMGRSGWLGKVQSRLQQPGFLFSPKSCQRSVDSGLFLSYDALMDILLSGSVRSIARFIHLDFTSLSPTKLSQTPETPWCSAALTFGWALPQQQPLPYKPPAGGTLRRLLCPRGAAAALPWQPCSPALSGSLACQ